MYIDVINVFKQTISMKSITKRCDNSQARQMKYYLQKYKPNDALVDIRSENEILNHAYNGNDVLHPFEIIEEELTEEEYKEISKKAITKGGDGFKKIVIEEDG
jgi:hypothetical protein